jgi:hypothetical protein
MWKLAVEEGRMAQSVLAKAHQAVQGKAAIPYIVIENALPETYYHELASSFPSDSYVAGSNEFGSDRVHHRCALDVIDDARLPAVWRDFFEYHSSRAFFDEVCALWRAEIDRHHPTVDRVLGKPLEAWTVGRRSPGKATNRKNENYDLVLDCQFTINRSVEAENAIRGAHLDSPRKLFAALLYMREPGDRSCGGELEFFRLRRGRYPKSKPSRISLREVERVDRINYQANTLVMFLNTPLSIHGVTPRSVSPLARRYINFLGECYGSLPNDFFITPEPRAPVWYRWVHRNIVRYL